MLHVTDTDQQPCFINVKHIVCITKVENEFQLVMINNYKIMIQDNEENRKFIQQISCGDVAKIFSQGVKLATGLSTGKAQATALSDR